MCTYNLPWREERGEKTKTIWRNNLQSFLNLIKTINLQFKSSVKPKHRKHKENYARADHNKMLKTSDKKKVLKATKVKKKKKKHVIHRLKNIKVTADFLLEKMQLGRLCSDMSRVLRWEINPPTWNAIPRGKVFEK